MKSISDIILQGMSKSNKKRSFDEERTPTQDSKF